MADSFRVFGFELAKLTDDLDIRHFAMAYACVIFLNLASFGVVFMEGYYASGNPLSARPYAVIGAALMAVSIPVGALADFGFIVAARRWGSMFLAQASALFLVVSILLTGLNMVSEAFFMLTLSHNEALDTFGMVVSALTGGFFSILFGIALYKARQDRLVKAAGAGNVLVGLVYMTVFLVLFGFFASFPVMALNAYVLWREGKAGRPAVTA
jgi:hypothetical protein